MMPLFALISVAIAGIWEAFVFSRLFNWFVAPTFNLNPIGIIMAAGLLTCVAAMKIKIPKEKEKETTPEETVANMIGVSCGYALALVIGFIISLFL